MRNITGRLLRRIVLALAAAAVIFQAAPADAQKSFYEGKTLRVVVRSGPGGGYDLYGRLIARHIVKHIPGKPRSIVVNMAGAGGIVAANYLANEAANDGLTIAILAREIAVAQLAGARGVRYDVMKLIPIGSAESETRVLVVRKDVPVTMEGLKGYKGTLKFAASGPGAGSYQLPKLLVEDGFPVRIITGIDSTPEQVLAVIRGDVEGTSGGVEAYRQSLKEGSVKILARLGPEPKDAPNVRDFLSAKNRDVADLLAAQLIPGRPFFLPPGTPEDRVKILRDAFVKTLADPELRAEAERAKHDITLVTGEEVAKLLKDTMAIPKETLTRLKELKLVGD